MYNIIPQPVSILTNSERKGFTLHAGTTVTPCAFADMFISFVRKTLNKKVRIQEDTDEEKTIVFKIEQKPPSETILSNGFSFSFLINFFISILTIFYYNYKF